MRCALRAGEKGSVQLLITRAQARLMLQTMLAEPFGLKFHREMKDTPVYALVAAKSGPKLEAVPSIPEGFRFTPGNRVFAPKPCRWPASPTP